MDEQGAARRASVRSMPCSWAWLRSTLVRSVPLRSALPPVRVRWSRPSRARLNQGVAINPEACMLGVAVAAQAIYARRQTTTDPLAGAVRRPRRSMDRPSRGHLASRSGQPRPHLGRRTHRWALLFAAANELEAHRDPAGVRLNPVAGTLLQEP